MPHWAQATISSWAAGCGVARSEEDFGAGEPLVRASHSTIKTIAKSSRYFMNGACEQGD